MFSQDSQNQLGSNHVAPCWNICGGWPVISGWSPEPPVGPPMLLMIWLPLPRGILWRSPSGTLGPSCPELDTVTPLCTCALPLTSSLFSVALFKFNVTTPLSYFSACFLPLKIMDHFLLLIIIYVSIPKPRHSAWHRKNIDLIRIFLLCATSLHLPFSAKQAVFNCKAHRRQELGLLNYYVLHLPQCLLQAGI